MYAKNSVVADCSLLYPWNIYLELHSLEYIPLVFTGQGKTLKCLNTAQHLGLLLCN